MQGQTNPATTSSKGRALPPDPRTIAEMIPVRQAEIRARNAKPRCHIKGHGVMKPRDLGRQTYEQMWCGVWYDCQHPGCWSSTSYLSRELAAYHGEPYVVREGEYETWTGSEWVPITQAEYLARAQASLRKRGRKAGAR